MRKVKVIEEVRKTLLKYWFMIWGQWDVSTYFIVKYIKTHTHTILSFNLSSRIGPIHTNNNLEHNVMREKAKN